MAKNNFYLFSYLAAQRKNKMGIWDSLCFLVSKMIINKGISSIDTESLCKVFKEYYSYEIPLYPMKELIRRMYSKDLLIKANITDIKPNFHKLKEYTEKDNNELYNFNSLLSEIKEYINKHFQKSYTDKQIEDGVLAYLNEYQEELLSNYTNISPIEIEKDKDILYMINHFIFYKLNDLSSFKEDLINLVLANLNLNSIFYNRADSIPENIKCKIYLDTRIIFRLIGCEGEYKKKEYESLIKTLLERKCELRVFEQHYEEVQDNLKDCEKWINSDDFNYDIASPVLQFFHDNHKSLEDVKLYEAKLETYLNEYHIKRIKYEQKSNDPEIIDSTSSFSYNKHRLKELLISEYKKCNDYFDEYGKNQIIENDVLALMYIHDKRQNKKPEKLSMVTHLLLTTNSALVKANRRWINEDDDFYRFTECLTDSFFGSYIWLTTNDNAYLLQNKLISSSYDYIKINPKIKKDFFDRIERQKESLTEKEYITLREDELCYGLLAEKSLNHEDYITDKTPSEIIYAYKQAIREEAFPDSKKYEENQSVFEHVKGIISKLSRFLSLIILLGIALLINLAPAKIITLIPIQRLRLAIVWLLRLIGAYITYSGLGLRFLTKDIVYKKINKFLLKMILNIKE